MMKSGKIPYRWISVVLGILVFIVSFAGLSFPSIYRAETPSWQAQCIGQDWFNLLIAVPALVLTGFLIQRKWIWRFLWSGALAYLLYSFVIYSFAVRFNGLFLIYCFILSINFFSLMLVMLVEYQKMSQRILTNQTITRVTGFFFVLIAISFYVLWLADIIPASLSGYTPTSLLRNGLLTNPVQVLDIAIFLPMVLITGIGLIRHHNVAFYLSLALLCFFILMNLTIAWLSAYMYYQGLEKGMTIVWGMLFLTALSLLLLILMLRAKKEKDI